jgi:hypothetical protein
MNLNSFWLGLGFAGVPLGLVSAVLSLVLAAQDRGATPANPSVWAWLAWGLIVVTVTCGCLLFAALYNIATGRDRP